MDSVYDGVVWRVAGLGLAENDIGELIGDPHFAASPEPEQNRAEQSLPVKDSGEPRSRSSSERNLQDPVEAVPGFKKRWDEEMASLCLCFWASQGPGRRGKSRRLKTLEFDDDN